MFGRRDKPGNDEKAFANGWAAGVRGMNGTYLKKPPPKPKTAPLKAWRVTFGDGYTEIVKADGYELRKRHATFFRLKRHPACAFVHALTASLGWSGASSTTRRPWWPSISACRESR